MSEAKNRAERNKIKVIGERVPKKRSVSGAWSGSSEQSDERQFSHAPKVQDTLPNTSYS